MKLASVVVALVVVDITIWCSVAFAQLAPINPDNLDPDAAHVCQETETEAYTQPVNFTQYYMQKTYTWCFNIPPRCTAYRTVSNTTYKLETYYRIQKRYLCCNGYKPLEGHSYCVPVCEHDCYQDKYHGYCVTPGKCDCRPGYKGTYCESGCDSQHWGQNCSKICNCGNYGSCDPVNGNCICHIGYTGQNCSEKCQESFGLHCIYPCICENDAICDHVNGTCTCKEGFYGAYCHKSRDRSSSEEQDCP